MELIHMTVAYSNAVLVAVLPHVSGFAAKLDLPTPQPIAASQVLWSHAAPYKDWVEDALVLTNGYWFLIDARGFVSSFRAPTNWFFEQEFTDERIRGYLGQDHMTTNEVISMARDSLVKLGYKPELTHSYETPTLEGPFDLHRKEIAGHVPYCRVMWDWPKEAQQNHITIEINMQTKTLVGMYIAFSRTNNLSSTPIKVGVVPELEADYQKRMKASSRMFFNTNAPPRFPQKPL